jgi:hypothetical protein
LSDLSAAGDRENFEVTTTGGFVREFGGSCYTHWECKIGPGGVLFEKDITSGVEAVRIYNTQRELIKNWVGIGQSAYGLAFDHQNKIYVVVNPTTINVYDNYNTTTPSRDITSPNFNSIAGIDVGN